MGKEKEHCKIKIRGALVYDAEANTVVDFGGVIRVFLDARWVFSYKMREGEIARVQYSDEGIEVQIDE